MFGLLFAHGPSLMQKTLRKSILISGFLGFSGALLLSAPLYAISLSELKSTLNRKIFGYTHSEDYVFYSTVENGFFAAPNTKQIDADFNPSFLKRDEKKQAYIFSTQTPDQTPGQEPLYIYRLQMRGSLLWVGHDGGVDIVDISHLTESFESAEKTLSILRKEEIPFPILTTAALDAEKVKDPGFDLVTWMVYQIEFCKLQMGFCKRENFEMQNRLFLHFSLAKFLHELILFPNPNDAYMHRLIHHR